MAGSRAECNASRKGREGTQWGNENQKPWRPLRGAQTKIAAGFVRVYNEPTVSLPDLEALYDDHAPAIFAFALSMTRSEAGAKDVLQEIFCKMARRPQLLDGVRDELAFLLRLTYHQIVDESRRRQSRERREQAEPRLFESCADPDENLFRMELEKGLGKLPEEQRAVVHLKLWGGLTFAAIAETLDIPPNTAASRYRYGLDKLRDELRPLYEEIQ